MKVFIVHFDRFSTVVPYSYVCLLIGTFFSPFARDSRSISPYLRAGKYHEEMNVIYDIYIYEIHDICAPIDICVASMISVSTDVNKRAWIFRRKTVHRKNFF